MSDHNNAKTTIFPRSSARSGWTSLGLIDQERSNWSKGMTGSYMWGASHDLRHLRRRAPLHMDGGAVCSPAGEWGEVGMRMQQQGRKAYIPYMHTCIYGKPGNQDNNTPLSCGGACEAEKEKGRKRMHLMGELGATDRWNRRRRVSRISRSPLAQASGARMFAP